VSDVKEGKISKEDIQEFVKTGIENSEKLETKLREEFVEEKDADNKVNIAQAIDIVTQEAGKKPKEPVSSVEKRQEVTFAGIQDLPGENAGMIQVKVGDSNVAYNPEKHILTNVEQVKLKKAKTEFKGEALTEPEAIKRLEEPTKPKEKPSKTVEEFEQEVKKIQKKPKHKKGDVVDHPEFGKIEVVDDSDPSKVTVRNDLGMEFELGRKALEEPVIEKTVDNKTNTATITSGEKIDLAPQPKPGKNLNVADPSKESLGISLPNLGGKQKETRKALKDVINSDPDAKAVDEMYDRAKVESDRKHHKSLKGWRDILTKAFVDVSGNLRRKLVQLSNLPGSRKVLRRKVLAAGSTSRAIEKLEAAYKRVYKDLNNLEIDYLNRIIQSRRTIIIEGYTDIKHPEALGEAQHQKLLDTIPEPMMNKLNPRADLYFSEFKGILDMYLEKGIVSKEGYDALVSRGDYSPRKVLHHIDPDLPKGYGGSKISISSSGIRSLEEGTYGLLELDSQLLLNEAIFRAERRVSMNDASKALYDFALANPDNGLVRVAKVDRVTRAGRPIYEKAGSGEEKVSVMIDGQSKEMIMPRKMAQEWVISDPLINESIARVSRIASGSFILKPMATGLNPEFAITNLPRDIAHAWLTTQEYNPVPEIAAVQFAKDYSTIFKDAVSRKGRYLDFVRDGGMIETLTQQGGVTKNITGKLKMFEKVMGYLGNTSEIMTRLALRERTIKNRTKQFIKENNRKPNRQEILEIEKEGSFVARDYLDFAQGGDFAKVLDTGIPYLNASIQGTRGIFRAAKQNPALFTSKVALLGAHATGLYLANHFLNKDAYEQVSPTDKRNNFVFTTPFYYKDKNGNKRYVYFKIPKDHGQRFITSVFETIAAKAVNDPNADIDHVMKSAQDLVVGIVPEQNLPPSLDAVIGYSVNKDFWRNEDIWNRDFGRNVIPEEEYTTKTPKQFVEFGKLTGASPERTQYAFEQVFTQGNVYTSLVGAGFNKIYGELPEAQKQEFTKQLLDQPFIRRFANETHPANRTANKLEQEKVEVNTERWKNSRELNNLVDKYIAGSGKFSDLQDFVDKQDFEEQKRLANRVNKSLQMRDVPNRGYWLDLAEMPPEARAHSFYAEWKGASGEYKEQLESYYDVVPGVYSDTFVRTLRHLSRKNDDKVQWLRRRKTRRSRREKIIIRRRRRTR
jgi:hypothetical protein